MQMSRGGGGGGGGSRMMSPKQLLTTILIVFSALSFIKLLLITSSSMAGSATSAHHRRESAWGVGGGVNGSAESGLTAKEVALLRSVVAARAPCRLLVFGLSPQLLALAKVNSGEGAVTAFVTDSAEDADSARRVLARRGAANEAGSAAFHQVRYRNAAGEAWPLLRRARANPACRLPTGTVRKSGCHLALTTLTRELLDAMWDVLVVDGPSGAGPEEPGRMAAIYTAAALARAAAAAGGRQVDVAVHDVDRTVERWYAWEYLCEDNLVAAKGRLWHFRVAAGGPPDAFCSTGPVQIL
ncbi:hypothetical protein GUJ93_ZPchr0011g28741 [Zizania palustris]|uniref:Polysaccharide biosynthesis domain-containing protein n=1 Tax=Zizania palustris TaxID=103762 RepID=A0A8J5WK13_ZIZPA|nr:hypothetical protein GUJ93_ZPchr0011g28741 [Zizania palustris]